MEEDNVLEDINYSSSQIRTFLSRVQDLKKRLSKMSGMFTDYTATHMKSISKLVSEVNTFSSEFKKISIDDFRIKTEEFKNRLRNGERIESILPEALALVREAIKRTLSKYPYDTQIEASIAMIGSSLESKDENGNMKDYYQRVVAEMKTGEGKTIVGILVSYINLLEATKDEDKSKWKSVHVMTSNDALAKRDSDENRKVFNLLGFSCGFVPSRRGFINMSDEQISSYKKKQYACDIVYASPSTIAFDYLHDNIIYNLDSKYLLKPFGFALIDEADDILIDQATNPLKLSMESYGLDSEYDKKMLRREQLKIDIYKWITGFLYGQSGIRSSALTYVQYDQYFKVRNIINNDSYKEDYAYCKDTGDVFISSRICSELRKIFPKVSEYNTYYFALLNCIKARHQYIKGIEYNLDVEGDKAKVVIIDQNIGRKKLSSKYINGMQEAIEAKEEFMEQYHEHAKKRYHVTFSKENIIKAMYTYPDFLNLYECRVSGMTGTSDEEELHNLYGFDTYKVKTRKKNIRVDEEDLLFATKKEKYDSIIKEVKKCVLSGQPVLIGTTSVQESLEVSKLLTQNNITHNLLNALTEEKENEIIKTAGLYGSVTVSTNMAGRGTDIKLGPGVKELGGLVVIGTSKNKSIRIDKQLRGRAARQGNPGRSKYYFSLEDDLVREQYKGQTLKYLIDHYSTGNPIKNKKVISAASRCQILQESKDKADRLDNEKFNKTFIRQRKIIYKERNKILESTPIEILNILKRIINKYSNILVEENGKKGVESLVGHLVNIDKCYDSNKTAFKENLNKALMSNIVLRFEDNKIDKLQTAINMKKYALEVKKKMLNVIDEYWINHMNALEQLQNSKSIYSFEDPFQSFEYEANKMFYNELIPNMYNEMITYASMTELKYGDYEIKLSKEALEERKILI